jgi:hypothetical protein
VSTRTNVRKCPGRLRAFDGLVYCRSELIMKLSKQGLRLTKTTGTYQYNVSSMLKVMIIRSMSVVSKQFSDV